MKKAYSAPDIAFESFSLSSSIAACDVETNHSQGTCGYRMDDGTVIFMTGVTGCDWEIDSPSGSYNGICYDNPSDLKTLFSS